MVMQSLRRRAAGEQPHDDIADVVFGAVVIHRDDVRVFKRRRDLGFAVEALDVTGLARRAAGSTLIATSRLRLS